MFDLGWSKLLIIAILAIVVVGPKELPGLMRTIGKFIGQIKRQADEFRAQLRDAMKDTEIEQITRDVADIKRSATDSVRDIGRSIEDSTKPLEQAAADIERLGNAPEIVGPEGQTRADPTSTTAPTQAVPQIASEPAASMTEIAASKPNGAAPVSPETPVKVGV